MSGCSPCAVEDKRQKPMETNGCLGGRETQSVFTDGVDIGIEA